MRLPAMELQVQGYKIRKILRKNQHTQRKLLNFVNRTKGEPKKIICIRPNLYQSH